MKNRFKITQPKTVLVRVLSIVLIFAVLLATLFIVPYTKLGMRATVTIWESKLTEFAKNHLASANPEIITFLGYRAVCYQDTNSVFFERTGLVFPYNGFFYSDSGAPVGFQGTTAAFETHGNGWIWRETDGDNWMYVEKISAKWYWYEMHF